MIQEKALLEIIRRRPKGILTRDIHAILIKEGILTKGEHSWSDACEIMRLLVGLEEKGNVLAVADTVITIEGGSVTGMSPVQMRWILVRPKNEDRRI